MQISGGNQLRQGSKTNLRKLWLKVWEGIIIHCQRGLENHLMSCNVMSQGLERENFKPWFADQCGTLTGNCTRVSKGEIYKSPTISILQNQQHNKMCEYPSVG